jgi:cell division transport system permease protein
MSATRRAAHRLVHYLRDAAASLSRGWRTSVLSLATIVAAVFVLGAVLLVSSTIERVLDRWSRAAEMSVYLRATVTSGQRADVERTLEGSALVERVGFVDAAAAARRFAREFPDLAMLAGTPGSPVLPASFEVQLRTGATADVEVQALARRLQQQPGVSDVQYDRGLIDRIARMVAVGRAVAYTAVAVLTLAAALSILSVVRLSYVARREEVEILTLVGAPFGAIRGPFIAEGWLQGTGGALLALVLLAAGFVVLRARHGPQVVEATGLDRLDFLSPTTWVAIVLASGLLGALAGAAAVERRIAEMT